MHQWYWSYEYSDFITDSGESIDFDSYMIPAVCSGKTLIAGNKTIKLRGHPKVYDTKL